MFGTRAAASVARLGCTVASRPSKRSLLLTISSRSVQSSAPLCENVQPARAGDDGSDVAKKLAAIITTTDSPDVTNHVSKRELGGPHDGKIASKQDRHFDNGNAGGRGRGGRGGGRGGRVRGRGRGSGGRVAMSRNRHEEKEGDGQSRRRERGADRQGGRDRGNRTADSDLRGGRGARAQGAGGRDDLSNKPLKFQQENTASKEYVDTMMILGRNGQWFKANRAYKEALENPDVEMTVYMFNATIAALAKSGRWSEAITVLDDMRAAGHSMDAYTYNAMIQACVNGGQGPRALKLFDEMSEAAISPDAFTFNHLIKGCKDGQWQRAIDLVKQMDNAGLVVSSVTYNGLIIACGNAGEVDKALSFLQVMRDRQIMLTEGSFSAAILACGKAGRWERAVSLLDDMEDDDLLPNCYCYNAAMQACLVSERWPEAVDILRRSMADPDNADRINFKPTLMACARAGEVRLAQQLIQEIHEAGHLIPQNTINYVEYAERTIKRHGKPGDGSSGSGLASAGEEVAQLHENEEASAPHGGEQNQSGDGDAGGERKTDTRGAEQTLASTTKDEAGGPGLDGDDVIDEAVARSPSEKTTAEDERVSKREKREYERPPKGESEVVLDNAEGKVQVELSKTKIKSKHAVNGAEGPTSETAHGSSPAVSAKPTPVWEPPYSSRKFLLCVKELTARGDGQAAVKLLKSAIEDPALKVTMTMYEAGLMSAAQHGLLPEAMSILGWIRECGLQPSSMCMVWAIRACAKAEPANVPVALALLKHMDPPDAWGYSAALSACANGHKWQKSLELLEEMSAVGLRANVHCYSATMAALAKADPPQIDQVEILLDDMQRAGIEPNNVTYDIAIRAYLDAGKTPSAENLYEAMKKAGVQPLNDLRRRLEASKKEPTVD